MPRNELEFLENKTRRAPDRWWERERVKGRRWNLERTVTDAECDAGAGRDHVSSESGSRPSKRTEKEGGARKQANESVKRKKKFQ